MGWLTIALCALIVLTGVVIGTLIMQIVLLLYMLR
jgi:hypothetical protein